MSIPSAQELQNPSEITIEAWLYPHPISSVNSGFINKSDNAIGASSRSYELQFTTDQATGAGSRVVIVLFLNNGSWAVVSAPAAEDKWLAVAACFSSSQAVLQLFTNGILATVSSSAAGGSSPLTGTLLRQTTLPVRLGRIDYPPYNYARGYMDEVRIWNKARTVDEIYANRFCRLADTESNLVAYYTFDDGTANDQTGHGHNGSYTGNAHAEAITGADSIHAVVCGAVMPVPARVASANMVAMNGFVIGATILDGGSGYTNTPTVRFFEGGGNGAQAVAVVSNGVVTALDMLDAGYGYTSQPVIVIAPPFIEHPLLPGTALSLLSFSNLVVGTNYQLQAFRAGTLSKVGGAFIASSSTFAQYVPGTDGASDYRLAVLPVPPQAHATALVVNGFVVGAIVTSGGSGYTTSPAVTIRGGGGSNATAIARVGGGAVTNMTITSAGIGYTNTPTITIAPPPASTLLPTVTRVMNLDLWRLAPYDNYQLEFRSVLGQAWSNLAAPFIPTSTTNTQRMTVTGQTRFFRAKHLP